MKNSQHDTFFLPIRSYLIKTIFDSASGFVGFHGMGVVFVDDIDFVAVEALFGGLLLLSSLDLDFVEVV